MTLRIAALFTIGLAAGQSFEVAAIRPHQGVVQRIGFSINGTEVTGLALTVRNLILNAYDLKDYQIEGASGWMSDDAVRYDINARVSGDSAPSFEQVRPMLQKLLAERFHLQFRRVTREFPAYVLVVGKSTPKLKPSDSIYSNINFNAQGQETLMAFRGVTMDGLARQLSTLPGVGRPVLDKTGLGGKFDFDLRLAAFQMRMMADPGAPPVTGPSGESIFTAVEEQIGLKMEAQKAPIEVLVIDRVERPTEN